VYENPKSHIIAYNNNIIIIIIIIIILCGIYKNIILCIPYCHKYTLCASCLHDISVFVSDLIFK
jgi:hypothetical protein